MSPAKSHMGKRRANRRVTEATRWLAAVNHRVRFYVLGGRSARENAAQHTLERLRGALSVLTAGVRSRVPAEIAPR